MPPEQFNLTTFRLTRKPLQQPDSQNRRICRNKFYHIAVYMLLSLAQGLIGAENLNDPNALYTNNPDLNSTPKIPGAKWPKILPYPAGANNKTPGTAFLDQLSIAPYQGSSLYHKVYLPTDWVPRGNYPVIIEYLGNSGKVASAPGMTWALTNGQGYITVTLPFVKDDLTDTDAWWGSILPYQTAWKWNRFGVDKTVEYAKAAVPAICQKWGGDPTKVLLVGFSRGAIACNYVGLHDDAIAKLWRGMITISHYDDGHVDWLMTPGEKALAPQRLLRLGTIPQLICTEFTPTRQTNATISGLNFDQVKTLWKLVPKTVKEETESFIDANYPQGNISYLYFPYMNHTLDYVYHDIPERALLRDWMRNLLNTSWERWVKTYWSATTPGFYDDQDNDGSTNLREYALGGNPFIAEPPLIARNIRNNRLTLTFTRDLAKTDIIITVEGSNNPDHGWMDLAISEAGGAFKAVQGGVTVRETGYGAIRDVEVADFHAIDNVDHPQRFIRLRVRKPQSGVED